MVVHYEKSRIVHFDDYVITFPRPYRNCVHIVRAGKWVSVFVGDEHVVPMHMHLVSFIACANKAHSQYIAFLDPNRLGEREGSCVYRKVVRNILRVASFAIYVGIRRLPSAHHQNGIQGNFFFECARVFGIDNHWPPHPAYRHVLPDIYMAVVPQASGTINIEFIGIRLPGLNCFLRDAWHTVLLPTAGLINPMPMDSMGKCGVVGHMYHHIISLLEADKWSRHLSVERKNFVGKAWGCFY